jgi:hypothetical protein
MKIVLSNLFGTRKVELTTKEEISRFKKEIKEENIRVAKMIQTLPKMILDVAIHCIIVLLIFAFIG